MKIKYKYYICRGCGKRIIPFSNPCQCPHCGKVSIIK